MATCGASTENKGRVEEAVAPAHRQWDKVLIKLPEFVLGSLNLY
jgi:hypothetical protein